tara:strand:+ start:8237 stop:8542 length:306 start_codon:yes stop_codon:yes gene_type:complete
MSTQYPIENWDLIVKHFNTLFGGLGEIIQDDKSIRFCSIRPDVETSISIDRNGDFGASMPLHGAEGKIDNVLFSNSKVILSGQNLNYTYRIPPEILSKRME